MSILERKYIYGYVIWGVTCGMLGLMTGFSYYSAIFLLVGAGIIIYISPDPIRAIGFLILMSPFAGTTYFRENIFGISGSKPIQMLAFIICIISVYHYNKSVSMPRWASYLTFGILGLFTISVFRSLQYLDLYNLESALSLKSTLTSRGYVLTEYIKPLIYLIPFVVMVKYGRKKEKVLYIFYIIYIAMVILSVHLLYLYLFQLKSLNIGRIDEYYSEYYGMHRNDLATFYVIGFPIALGIMYAKKRLYNIFFNIIIICAIGILFSRTAYVTAVFTVIVYLVILKRVNIVSVIIIGFIVITISVFGIIVERAKTGFESKNKNVIMAGRLDSIWIPLIDEYIENSNNLIFGRGRYSIMASNARKSGKIIGDIRHPHNMYLELIMDAGVFGLTIYVVFYYTIMRIALRTLHLLEDDNLRGLVIASMISIICFLLSGFTGRSFFPELENILIWVVFGCLIALYETSKAIYIQNRGIEN